MSCQQRSSIRLVVWHDLHAPLLAIASLHTHIYNTIGGTKGVNLPGVVVDLPAVTAQDERDILVTIHSLISQSF
jgi:pyruvate kinase